MVLLPGSQAAGYLKRWGAHRYAALAERLFREDGLRCLLLGGPDDLGECAVIEAQAGPYVVNLCGATELLDLVPLCAWSKYVVGNDTGTAHVASAAGRPLVVISVSKLLVSMVRNVVTLQTEGLDCINCYCKRPCDHHTCMSRIEPSVVHRTAVQASGERVPEVSA